jgi:hypothetical protein
MARFGSGSEPPTPYSDLKPERFGREDALGVQFPGEDAPRVCGVDPDMPPAAGNRYYERPVNLGFAGLKRRS